MANTIFQLRRNTVSGTRPTTLSVSSGELAINTTDGILFSANTTSIFEIGSNNTNIAVGNSSSRFIVNTTAVAIGNSQGLIANGSLGTANQVLASNGSGVYWANSGGGGGGSASAPVRQTFIANATVNTTFAVSGGYTVGYVDVYKNGVKLINGTDVTVTNGIDVVLANPAVSNDVIDIVGFIAGIIPIVNSAISVRETFTANATVNTTFTVSSGYTAGYIDVYYNGVKLVNGTDVTATNGSTIVLSSAAPSGTIIDVVGLTGGSILIPTVNNAVSVRQTFTANSTVNTTFTITGGYTANYIDIYSNGAKLVNGTDVTASDGSTIVLSSAAPSGTVIDVVGLTGGTILSVNTSLAYLWTNIQTFQSNAEFQSNVTIASTGELIISNGAGIYANGTLGTNNQVLTSNGTGVSWSAKSVMSYRSVISNTTVLATDNLIIANGTLTVTLPAASTVAGQQFYIKNINNTNGIITVLPNGSELIDGYANATIRYYNTMFGVISVGTGWVIF